MMYALLYCACPTHIRADLHHPPQQVLYIQLVYMCLVDDDAMLTWYLDWGSSLLAFTSFTSRQQLLAVDQLILVGSATDKQYHAYLFVDVGIGTKGGRLLRLSISPMHEWKSHLMVMISFGLRNPPGACCLGQRSAGVDCQG